MNAEFLHFLRLYRVLWLSGRPGGGKTSLALWLAFWLVEHGYSRYIGTNLELNVGTVVGEVDSAGELVQWTDTAIIYDEAWAELGTGFDKSVRTWLAYPRKMNQVLLFPSVLPLVKHVQTFRVQRVFNGYLLGLPLWFYRWTLGNDRKPDKGSFVWWNPARVFPTYNHEAVPGATYKVYEL